MKLHVVDILIICAYLIVIVLIGLFLKKKAAKNMDSYFLGGKSLPFYMLGLSNASGMFDITGTMLMVYIGPLHMVSRVCGFLGCGRCSIRYS